MILNSSFNSHPHKEDDVSFICYSPLSALSTHILTRRMTFLSFQIPHKICLSTHILTRRMTKVQRNLRTMQKPFNSHPHKEDDAMKMQEILVTSSFNSHPHKEDDSSNTVIVAELNLSTHILTRRMTNKLVQYHSLFVFQLTSSQGG